MKPMLYLIPGTMCNKKLWSEIFEHLDSQFDIVHVAIPRGNSLDEIIDSLLNVISKEKSNLVGFSLGGYLASYFAAKYPEKVGRLFIISNSPCELNSDEIRQRKEILNGVALHGYSGVSRKKVASLIDKKTLTNKMVQTIIEMNSELGENIFTEQIRLTMKRKDLSLSLHKLDIPITFFYSLEDPLVNGEWIQNFTKSHRKSVSNPISGSGHMLPLEKPKELVRQLETWSTL